MPEKFLTRAEQSRHLTEERGLPVSKKTLQKLATTGGGPPYRIFGNKAVTTQAELDAWADAKLSAPRRSTSEVEVTAAQQASPASAAADATATMPAAPESLRRS